MHSGLTHLTDLQIQLWYWRGGNQGQNHLHRYCSFESIGYKLIFQFQFFLHGFSVKVMNDEHFTLLAHPNLPNHLQKSLKSFQLEDQEDQEE